MKEGYKKTEVGVIPEDWEVKRFKDISKINQGLQIAIEDRFKEQSTNRLPYLTIQYINDKDNKDNEFYIENANESVICKEDEILMTRTGNTGAVITNEYGVFHNNFFKIDFDRSLLNKDYLVYYLKSTEIQKIINRYAGTTTIPDLKHSDFYRIPIFIPPLKEQEKIADILSTVDGQIDDTDMLIKKCQELKKGLMQRLLTRGIGHTEFKKTEIGEIPVEWEVKNIGKCAEVTKLAGFEFTEYMEYKEEGEIIALRALNLKKGKLDLKDIKRIDKTVSENLQRSKLFKGNMLFSYVGTIGEVALIQEDNKYHLAPNVAKITFSNVIIPEFGVQYFTSIKLANEIKKYVTTTSQPALSMENIRKMKIVIPSIQEQVQIAQILSSIDYEIDEYENKKQKLEDLKKGVMQQLLTGNIRVLINH